MKELLRSMPLLGAAAIAGFASLVVLMARIVCLVDLGNPTNPEWLMNPFKYWPIQSALLAIYAFCCVYSKPEESDYDLYIRDPGPAAGIFITTFKRLKKDAKPFE